ncbi:bifunctional glutamate N-acetyltransferase/amino-acid acetyltransferase ArgJ [Parasulfitobacter algicola]|uniref:Arginine biosynthesis bifunctional protein ArgJ n=1 Tax=Parasulfitobacter algicola TaxID=2614809 RepID=A0ABX2ILX7_9RHOB|nr:bifunctional glutamate N-acetyltransferase/amino-acid acetyltransferase ArgJ [Sulfitobacter algicola]NSX53877.1 bifunctional glutamate N-acetyltransferase/amino-acid acetyltransferase ArgJ [Sulfitobacter algicola]
MKKSPLAPAEFPQLPIIDGVRFASVEAGVRYQGRKDVMLADLRPGTTIAGVFTKSATRSAPVLDCQSKLGIAPDQGAAIIVNSGNANAFTGKNGTDATTAVTSAVADCLDIPEQRVFSSSTGVIGEALAHSKITEKLNELKAGLSEHGIKGAAEAIMTTDTFAKGSAKTLNIGGKAVNISGIAKGSGMIAPDMATMLVYIFTDAKIAHPDLQAMLAELTDMTFNCITVDSDTSTSDTLLIAATGASGVDVTNSADFRLALHEVMLDLAHQVVKDGEGASKFVEIRVIGAASNTEAKQIGLAIANSPLVKTAIAGEDPNWGRVVMAVGKAGAQANRDLLSIRFGDILVAEKGWVSPDYKEQQGADYMKNQNLLLQVDLGLAAGMATVWTCDLTHDYIRINADYRS